MTRPIRIVAGLTATNEVGHTVPSMPIRYVEDPVATNELGQPVDAMGVDVVDAPASTPARVVAGLVTTNEVGNAVAVVPVWLGGDIPPPDPDPVYARTAITSTDTASHLGHSLVSDYISHGEWPGHLKRVVASMGIADAEDKHADNTTPGSGIQAQWELGDGRYGLLSPVSHIDQYNTLVITEAGPPPHITESGQATSPMTDTLDYLMRFACNLVENGAGNDLILWPCWPDNRGPGWTPAIGDDGAPPAGIWAGYDFRDGLEQYEFTFKYLADYVTFKVNALYPELGGTWRCWIAPSLRFWMRIYDDIQTGDVTGATTLQEMFSRDWNEAHTEILDDHIHASPLTGYGLALLVASMLYQRDLRNEADLWVPTAYTAANGIEWPALPPGRKDYYLDIIAEILGDYEPAGMGGTSGADPQWQDGFSVDPMPLWTFANPTRDPIPDPEPEPEFPADILGQITPSAVTGFNFSPALPAAVDGIRSIVTQHDSPAADATYIAIRHKLPTISGPIISMLCTNANTWSGHRLLAAVHAGYNTWVVSFQGGVDDPSVQPSTGPARDLALHTIETWYDSFAGTINMALDGGPVTTVIVPEIDLTFGYVMLAPEGGIYDLSGAIAMDRIPTANERAGIRQALAEA